MTHKALTPGASLRQLHKAGEIPADAEVDARRGRADWVERAMWFQLRLRRDPWRRDPSGLETILYVGPFGSQWDREGRSGLNAAVAVRPVAGQGEATEPAAWLVDFIREARAFVAGPGDLCWLLSQQADVRRGRLFAWLYQGYPARMVMALALARELGDPDRERAIVAQLHSGLLVETRPMHKEDILVSAQEWARILSKRTGRSLSL